MTLMRPLWEVYGITVATLTYSLSASVTEFMSPLPVLSVGFIEFEMLCWLENTGVQIMLVCWLAVHCLHIAQEE